MEPIILAMLFFAVLSPKLNLSTVISGAHGSSQTVDSSPNPVKPHASSFLFSDGDGEVIRSVEAGDRCQAAKDEWEARGQELWQENMKAVASLFGSVDSASFASICACMAVLQLHKSFSESEVLNP